MSEYSESYHIKGGTLEDSVNLIKASSVSGYAGKFNDEWSVLVPECEGYGGDIDKKIVKHNSGVLLYFSCAEDFGMMFKLFDGKKQISVYALDYSSDEPRVFTEGLNSSEFVKLTGIDLSADEFEAFLCPNDFDECSFLADNFMELIGIDPKAFSWVSYDYCQSLEPEYGFIEVI